MKTVIIRPERCVGCLQCRLACAVEHSAGKNLAGALTEPVRPVSRVAVYPGRQNFAFPNKCRHCDPAPCEQVCIAGAIMANPHRATVDIDAWRCINCGMCAMACPFGVLKYAATHEAPGKRAVALKCDQCPDREAVGRAPACVEACKVGALTYGVWEEAQADKARSLARAVFAGLSAAAPSPSPPETVRLWRLLG
jgi:carbon-monoxide dehydrogenase iron sulfur subunit